MPGSTFSDMNFAHPGQVGSTLSFAWKASGVPGSAWMSAVGILNFRAAGSLPWQVSQLNDANFLPSNSWKTGFIFGMTDAFMKTFFWLYVMSFQATWGGPTTFFSALAMRAAGATSTRASVTIDAAS